MDGATVRFGECKHTYANAGECIYRDASCGYDTARRLGDEHIVPEGIGGRLLLPRASCQYHERKVNEGFESNVQQFTLDAVRNLLQIPSKRKRKRPQAAAADFLIAGEVKTIFVPFTMYPVTITVPVLPVAGILKVGALERTNVHIIRMQHLHRPDQAQATLPNFSAKAARFKTGGLRFSTYTRLLAKVAHAFACAELGVGGFYSFLLPYILGDETFPADHFIGGSTCFDVAERTHILSLRLHHLHGQNLWICDLRLFANLGFPEYSIVVGSTKPCVATDLCSPREPGHRQWTIYQDELEKGAYEKAPNLVFIHQRGSDGILQTAQDVGSEEAVKLLGSLLERKAAALRNGVGDGLRK